MTGQAEAGELPDGVISEWHPHRGTILIWTIAQVPIGFIGIVIYLGIAVHGQFPTSGTVYFFPQIVALFALTFGLAAVHEAVHGITMLAFGARPQFGVLKISGIPAGFYATAPGYRFTWRQYLVVGLAPLALLAPLGVPACLLPFGVYLAIPFAVHLAGCVGDLTIVWHVLRAPSNVLVEDLRDGMRIWKAEA